MLLEKKSKGEILFTSVCHNRLLSNINLEDLHLLSQFWKEIILPEVSLR